MLMQVNLEAAGWWYAVLPEEDEEIVYRHDCLALATILRSVPPEMLAGLREKRTAAEARATIKLIVLGSSGRARPTRSSSGVSSAPWYGRRQRPRKISRTASPGSPLIYVSSATTSPTPRS